VRSNLFWLSDEQWKRIEPHLPTDVPGIERANDRRVISGIVWGLSGSAFWSSILFVLHDLTTAAILSAAVPFVIHTLRK